MYKNVIIYQSMSNCIWYLNFFQAAITLVTTSASKAIPELFLPVATKHWDCMNRLFPSFYRAYWRGRFNYIALFCQIVFKLAKLKVNKLLEIVLTHFFIFDWQNVSLHFSTFLNTDWQINNMFTEYINITDTWTEALPSYDEEFRILKLKLTWLKAKKTRNTLFTHIQ